MSGWGDFDVRPDLSHLPGFLLLPKGSGTTGYYQTHRRRKRRRGERGREGEKKSLKIELPHIENVNPSPTKKRIGDSSVRV